MTRYAVEYRQPSYRPGRQWVLSDTHAIRAKAEQHANRLRASFRDYDVSDAGVRVREIRAPATIPTSD